MCVYGSVAGACPTCRLACSVKHRHRFRFRARRVSRPPGDTRMHSFRILCSPLVGCACYCCASYYTLYLRVKHSRGKDTTPQMSADEGAGLPIRARAHKHVFCETTLPRDVRPRHHCQNKPHARKARKRISRETLLEFASRDAGREFERSFW